MARDVRMVYSPLDALALAAKEPGRHVCFFAIGFETTAPATAVTLLRARAEATPNFSVFCNHVLIEPPLRAILETPGLRVDAFIGPGHVSTVIGTDAYRFIAEEYGRPVVVSAFEPVDLLQSIAMLLRQRVEGRCEVENQYTRVVRREGNDRAIAAIAETMEAARGLRVARPRRAARRARSACGERSRALDAERLFTLPGARIEDPKACRCGDVLTRTDQAVGVRCLRHRLHAGAATRDLHGVERGRVRRVLLLRASAQTARGSASRCLRGALAPPGAPRRAHHPRPRCGREGDARPRRGALPRGARQRGARAARRQRPSSRPRAGGSP